MFHEVRILNPDGKIKQVVSSDKLSQLYWQQFMDGENNISLVSTGKARVPTWVKQHLDRKYPEFSNMNFS
ncbi:MAG: hypothetical protein IID18_10415 [Nitrospinae bacterium]|nr:hypothetical protein [Nitrospinota bacterium]